MYQLAYNGRSNHQYWMNIEYNTYNEKKYMEHLNMQIECEREISILEEFRFDWRLDIPNYYYLVRLRRGISFNVSWPGPM